VAILLNMSFEEWERLRGTRFSYMRPISTLVEIDVLEYACHVGKPPRTVLVQAPGKDWASLGANIRHTKTGIPQIVIVSGLPRSFMKSVSSWSERQKHTCVMPWADTKRLFENIATRI